MVGKLLDGVSDPIMGFLSDRTRTRWGRRRPWFIVGAAPFALSFIAMFSAEEGWSQLQLFLWLLSWNVLFWSAQTVINVPHAALAGEMVEQHVERNAIMGWREAMQQLGLLVGASAPLLVLSSMQDAAGTSSQSASSTQTLVQMFLPPLASQKSASSVQSSLLSHASPSSTVASPG